MCQGVRPSPGARAGRSSPRCTVQECIHATICIRIMHMFTHYTFLTPRQSRRDCDGVSECFANFPRGRPSGGILVPRSGILWEASGCRGVQLYWLHNGCEGVGGAMWAAVAATDGTMNEALRAFFLQPSQHHACTKSKGSCSRYTVQV